MWMVDLLAHGLIRASFVPPTPIQDMRTLMRTRKQLVRERVQHEQRIQKTLEDAKIKIASVVSDVIGTSGRAILRAIIDGKTDPEEILSKTTGQLRASRATLKQALEGRIRQPHRFLLKLHLGQIDGLDQSIAGIDKEVRALLEHAGACAPGGRGQARFSACLSSAFPVLHTGSAATTFSLSG